MFVEPEEEQEGGTQAEEQEEGDSAATQDTRLLGVYGATQEK